MSRIAIALFLLTGLSLAGCAEVYMTKTAKGFFPQTRPDDIEILMMKPDRPYIELASIATNNWKPGQIAKMHNALRAKAAPLGADAVVCFNSGIIGKYLWATGAAIRYTDKQ